MLPFTERSARLCFGFIVCLLLEPAPSFAAVYYVAQTPQAADENVGDAAQPWSTLHIAIGRAKPGDTILVGRGDYRSEDAGWGLGVIPFPSSGKPDSPIRVEAVSPMALVMSFLLKGKQHVEITNFSFQNPKFGEQAAWQDMPHTMRTIPVTPKPDFAAPLKDRKAWIERNFADYFNLIEQLDYRSAVDLEGCHHISIRSNRIDGYWAGIQCRGCERISIQNNEISHCVNGIYTWLPAPALAFSRIESNRISQCLDNGIDVRQFSHHVDIRFNTVRYSGRSHIALHGGTHNCTIGQNNVQFGGYYSESIDYPGSSAISIHSSGAGVVVESNLAAYQLDPTAIDGNGIILDMMQDQASVTVRHNVLFRNTGAGLNLTVSPGATIHHNAFIENGHGSTGRRVGVGIKFSRDQDVGNTIVSNIFAGNHSAGILGYKILDRQKRIYRNLCISRTDTPLIWDGYDDGERAYLTLDSVREVAPWEKNGVQIGPFTSVRFGLDAIKAD